MEDRRHGHRQRRWQDGQQQPRQRHPALLWRLRRRIDVSYESWLDSNSIQDPEELGARLRSEEIAALVVEADFVFEEVFDAAPGLRMVGVCRNASSNPNELTCRLPSSRQE